MKQNVNLQDAFLTKARMQNMPLTVFLVNGFQMRGIVRGFDPSVVVLDVDGRQQMVYKHAISTIAPFAAIDLHDAEYEDEDD